MQQAQQKEKGRELEARLRVHERRLAAELGRWKEEADRADEMSGKIGAAESRRDAAVKRYVKARHHESGDQRGRRSVSMHVFVEGNAEKRSRGSSCRGHHAPCLRPCR